jgi:SAM-dependent methyltransferase
MSSELWDEVAARMDEHGYMKGVERTVDRVRRTGEVFTPTKLVIDMVRRLPLEQFAPGRTILDPACGDGQFLIAAKWIKVLFHGMAENEAVEDLFGVDIMSDNVELCRRRLGGGTILVGDALKADRAVPGQTEEDRRAMRRIFGGDDTQPAPTLFDLPEEKGTM